jgi:hypothetical protein
VTLGGVQAVAGSVLALVMLISAAQQLNGEQMTDTLRDTVQQEQVSALNLTVESARDLLRYSIMVMSVLSAASLVLAIFVLRRHRAARIGLTVVGALVGVALLVAGPVGWIGTLYIAVSIFLLWTRPARVWFGDGVATQGGGPPAGGPPTDAGPPTGPPYAGPPYGGPPTGGPPSNVGPPTGPRRDVDGRLPGPSEPTGQEDGERGDECDDAGSKG